MSAQSKHEKVIREEIESLEKKLNALQRRKDEVDATISQESGKLGLLRAVLAKGEKEAKGPDTKEGKPEDGNAC